MTDIVEQRTISESDRDDNGRAKADVIPIRPDVADIVTGQADQSITYQTTSDRGQQLKRRRIRKDFRDQIPFDQIRKKADKEIIDYAYHSIVDALDYEIDRIERSNLFDQWKDALDTILAEVTNVTANHRKILGAIIVATKGKDIADFARTELHILGDATYMFRQLRVTRSDSKKIIKKLIDIGADMAIPLATDDMSDRDKKILDELMRTLIKRSK